MRDNVDLDVDTFGSARSGQLFDGLASRRLVQIAGRWNDILQVDQYTRALRPEDFAPYAPVSRLMNGK